MNNSITYLFQRFLYRIAQFLKHWYTRSSRIYWSFVIDKIQSMDYSFAWKITLKNLFKPLYKDYSVIGHILGFIFRLGRLIIASIIYAALIIIAAIIFLFWLLFPIALIYKIFTG